MFKVGDIIKEKQEYNNEDIKNSISIIKTNYAIVLDIFNSKIQDYGSVFWEIKNYTLLCLTVTPPKIETYTEDWFTCKKNINYEIINE
jgi:hypothetical protein